MESKLPKDWKERRGFVGRLSRRGRFYVERDGDHDPYNGRRTWQIVDFAYATTLGGFRTKADATEAKHAAERYVDRHGDIDLGSFPLTLADPLNYDDPDSIDRYWAEEYPAIQRTAR